MELTNKIFSKSHEEIFLDDLKQFFATRQDETSLLEFKSGGIQVDELYKEITAFLNTEGGVIIVGAPKEQKEMIGNTKVNYCIGDLDLTNNVKSKDWLIQKIYTSISPAPTNIKVLDFITEKGNAFIVEVPQSMNPPHQVNGDGKYYIRIEREAKPAPHGLVEALFNKRKKPKLDAEIIIFPVVTMEDTLQITLSFVNKSNTPAQKASFLVDIYHAKDVSSDYAKFATFIEPTHDIDKRFRHSGSMDCARVIASVVKIPMYISIKHFKKPFVVFAGFWCSEQDFSMRYWLIDPIEHSVISTHSDDESTMSLTECTEFAYSS